MENIPTQGSPPLQNPQQARLYPLTLTAAQFGGQLETIHGILQSALGVPSTHSSVDDLLDRLASAMSLAHSLNAAQKFIALASVSQDQRTLAQNQQVANFLNDMVGVDPLWVHAQMQAEMAALPAESDIEDTPPPTTEADASAHPPKRKK